MPRLINDWRENPKAINKYQFVYHFLPHPQAGQRATLLSHKSLVVYCAVVLFFLATVKLLPHFLPGVLSYATDMSIRDLLYYTNQQREQAGLSDLRLNLELSKAAQKKATDMFAHNYWAHVSPTGVEPWSFILGENYDYIYAGENLAKNFSSSKDVVVAWYNSPSHRDNLLSPNYDEVGFAEQNGVLDGYETTLVVQMFGRPRDASKIAAVSDTDNILKQLGETSPASTPSIGKLAKAGSSSILSATPLPRVQVDLVVKYTLLFISGMIFCLLALDIWFTRRQNIAKFTGHSLSHLILFFGVIVCILFIIKPGFII